MPRNEKNNVGSIRRSFREAREKRERQDNWIFAGLLVLSLLASSITLARAAGQPSSMTRPLEIGCL